jgi:hypothetical protein
LRTIAINARPAKAVPWRSGTTARRFCRTADLD